MPTMPPKQCNKCRRAFTEPKCPHCYPAWQGSGYGKSGSTRRQRTMQRAQLDAVPHCQAPGCTRLATVADHIVPIAHGGARYDWDNLQSLCNPCHDTKTQRDAARGRARRNARR